MGVERGWWRWLSPTTSGSNKAGPRCRPGFATPEAYNTDTTTLSAGPTLSPASQGLINLDPVASKTDTLTG